jgi:hypothetical protein
MNEEIKIVNSRDHCNKSCGSVEIPTEDEKRALDALREIKDRVRVIKSRLGILAKDAKPEFDRESTALKKELDDLRIEWKKWVGKRDEAAKNRMILLGHADPD